MQTGSSVRSMASWWQQKKITLPFFIPFVIFGLPNLLGMERRADLNLWAINLNFSQIVEVYVTYVL